MLSFHPVIIILALAIIVVQSSVQPSSGYAEGKYSFIQKILCSIVSVSMMTIHSKFTPSTYQSVLTIYIYISVYI